MNRGTSKLAALKMHNIFDLYLLRAPTEWHVTNLILIACGRNDYPDKMKDHNILPKLR